MKNLHLRILNIDKKSGEILCGMYYFITKPFIPLLPIYRETLFGYEKGTGVVLSLNLLFPRFPITTDF